MNTNTDIDMSIDDDFYGDVDLTQEERDMIYEDSLVGRAYDEHQDWKDEESLREFCKPYVNWANDWHNTGKAWLHNTRMQVRADKVNEAKAIRKLFGCDL
tara:strand:- start:156 stop:455 length:300 start_codon:yes stop_codon:yes gene_type:complete